MSLVGARIGTISAVRITGPGSEYLIDREPVDVFLAGGLIEDIAPAGALPPRGEVLDGAGAWLIPGLWDNHVHTVQWALAAERVPLGGASSAADAARLMAAAEPLHDGRRVGSGFRDGLWSDAPSLPVLDDATGSVPTYLINADVHSTWLNTAALRREGFDTPDGMLREEDAFEISRRLNAVDPARADAAVRAAGRRERRCLAETRLGGVRRAQSGVRDLSVGSSSSDRRRAAHG